MPWHQQPRLRDKETVLEAVGLIKPLDSQGVLVLAAAEAARLRPNKPVDLVKYWIDGEVITVSGDIPMIDFVPIISNKTNIASLTLNRCTYFRIGDWVQVNGSFTAVPTDNMNDMSFEMTPPLPHTFVEYSGDFLSHLASLFANGNVQWYYSNPGVQYTPQTVPFMYWALIPA